MGVELRRCSEVHSGGVGYCLNISGAKVQVAAKKIRSKTSFSKALEWHCHSYETHALNGLMIRSESTSKIATT